MIVLMYFGSLMFFDKSFNLVETPLRDTQGNATNRLVLNTICFHTFFLMNWFNTLNSRIVAADDINIFKSICNNWYLWLIMLLELAVQLLMIKAGESDLGSALIGTSEITQSQHLVCWLFGIFSCVIHAIGKKIPIDLFKFAASIDLESESKTSFIDRQMNKYEDAYKIAN
jgi:magnesium-transporting ATPase (P-type)